MSSKANSSASANAQQQAAVNTHDQSEQTHEAASQNAPLPLPEPGHAGDTTQLSVGGEGVKLDHSEYSPYPSPLPFSLFQSMYAPPL